MPAAVKRGEPSVNAVWPPCTGSGSVLEALGSAFAALSTDPATQCVSKQQLQQRVQKQYMHPMLTGPRLLDVATVRALRKSGRSLCFGIWDGVCIPVSLSCLLGTDVAACMGPRDPLAPMDPMRSCIGDRILLANIFGLVLSAM